MSKNRSLKDTVPSYDQKFVCLEVPRQNICYKVKKSRKIGQD